MEQWTRREVLKLGVLASTVAFSPKWVEASTERNLALNRAAWASSSSDFIKTGHMSTDGLANTAWQSSDADLQWIYVDLGAPCNIRSVVLRWGANHGLAYKLQASKDNDPSPETGLVENWTDVHETLDGKGGVEQISLPETQARYVRMLLNGKAKPGGYELASFEVFGTGGFEPVAAPLPSPEADGTLRLSGGWKLVNQGTIPDKAAAVSTCGYDDSKWLIATVPGTVLTSYLNLGAVPDPFYGDDLSQISDFFAHTNWWYRNELEIPASYAGKRVWLNFEGINYRAYVFVNGKSAGSIDGAFVRGKFDVTELVTPGKKNCIAVMIMPVPKPDKVLPKPLSGYSWPAEYPRNEPTILAADSWDWLPTIRDRDTGIWNHVSFTTTGDVTVENPFASTHFPEAGNLKRADVTIKVDLKNHTSRACKGILKVRLGEIELTRSVTLDGDETTTLTLDKTAYPKLSLVDPKLWWPSGHGEQNLYDLTIEFSCNGKVSDVNKSRVGIREYSYSPALHTRWDVSKLLNGLDLKDLDEKAVKDPLTFFCNGKRIFIRGVNWGMDEGMLRCDREGFQIRVGMEREMNFNLIRNWGGNLDKPEFYEVCDELGILVWDEFGIANGLQPDDPGMWLVNARDRFLRHRNYASVVLWCTANETLPDDPIATEMPRMAEELDGTRMFLQSSIQLPPTNGDSPYDTRPARFYFKDLARGFRPELGSPTIPCVESMRRMMPHNKLWPVNEMWALHDWWLGTGWGTGSGLCGNTMVAIASYGAPKGIEDFCRKAQMVNTEVFKAIYEAWNDRMWNDCSGVMMWMSNPAWPSLTWNTYDYYKEPTAAYFACRKACEPIHIQWNVATNQVKAVNCTSTELKGLSVEAVIYNLDGSVFQTKSAKADCAANSAQQCLALFGPGEDKPENLSAVYFIKLSLKDSAGKLLSSNFYWNGKTEWKYEDLAGIKQVRVTASLGELKDGHVSVKIENPTSGIAVMARVKVVDTATGLLAVPVFYSDNYFSLTPQESQSIDINLKMVHAKNPLKVIVEGWNFESLELGTLNANA
jgi:hypothetical protein